MANLNFTFPIDQLASAIVEKMKIYYPTESKECMSSKKVDSLVVEGFVV